MLPINETMGQYSELFMLLAAGTYTVAFIAFAWDLARSSKALKAVDLKAAAAGATDTSAKVPVAAGAAAAAVAGTAWPDRQTVPSGRRRTPRAPYMPARPPTTACGTRRSAVPRPVWAWH